jgi:hypothetical protein
MISATMTVSNSGRSRYDTPTVTSVRGEQRPENHQIAPNLLGNVLCHALTHSKYNTGKRKIQTTSTKCQ